MRIVVLCCALALSSAALVGGVKQVRAEDALEGFVGFGAAGSVAYVDRGGYRSLVMPAPPAADVPLPPYRGGGWLWRTPESALRIGLVVPGRGFEPEAPAGMHRVGRASGAEESGFDLLWHTDIGSLAVGYRADAREIGSGRAATLDVNVPLLGHWPDWMVSAGVGLDWFEDEWDARAFGGIRNPAVGESGRWDGFNTRLGVAGRYRFTPRLEALGGLVAEHLDYPADAGVASGRQTQFLVYTGVGVSF